MLGIEPRHAMGCKMPCRPSWDQQREGRKWFTQNPPIESGGGCGGGVWWAGRGWHQKHPESLLFQQPWNGCDVSEADITPILRKLGCPGPHNEYVFCGCYPRHLGGCSWISWNTAAPPGCPLAGPQSAPWLEIAGMQTCFWMHFQLSKCIATWHGVTVCTERWPRRPWWDKVWECRLEGSLQGGSCGPWRVTRSGPAAASQGARGHQRVKLCYREL